MNGLCECGCNQPTKLAPQTSSRRGWVRGEPMPFLQGHSRRPSLEVAFRQRFAVGNPSDCWEWQGDRDPHGYGYLRHIRAHRLAYELQYGTIPEGMNILHRCDNRACVNPNHLFLGTQEMNIYDMVGKQRHVHGERHTSHKLTSQDVRAIRALRSSSRQSYFAIASQFGVSASAIEDIVRRITWKHVE